MRESGTKNRGCFRRSELYDRLGKGQYQRKRSSRGHKGLVMRNPAWSLGHGQEKGSLVFFRSLIKATRPVAAPSHRLRVCRPRLFNQGVCLLLQETQCAAMADAVRCVGRCSALHRHMHRVAFFGPMFSVCSQSGSYGSTRPETPPQQSRSYILHILFHWGEEHGSHFCAFLSIAQRCLFKSPTRPNHLSKESSSNRRQDPVLCPKNSLQITDKPHSLCPKKFY